MSRSQTHSEDLKIASDSEQFRKSATQLADDMKRVGDALKTLAGDSLDNVQGKLMRLYGEGRDRYNEAEGRFESKIRADPLKAVLIAAGVGFVLAYLRRK